MEAGVAVGTTGTRGTSALLAVSVVLIVLGAAAWAFDADPVLGKLLVIVGVVAAAAGRILVRRPSPRAQRVAWVVAALLAVLAAADAVHTVQVINGQRESHLAAASTALPG